MTNGALPLLDLFYELRKRNFPLGTSEYVTVLNALVKGAVTTRADLLFICQLVWAKSPEEQYQVAEAFAALLPKEFTENDLKESPPRPESLESKPPQSRLPDRPQTPEQTMRADPHFAFRFDHGADQNRMAPVSKTPWHLNPRLDFVGSLPITKRQMKSAWRYNRRMRRVGAPVELDVATTIEEIYRQGVFLKPMLIPRRQNQARVLILLDERGSMVPFRRVTQALLDSASQSGFARASLLFFHDVPGEHLFHEPWLNTRESTVRVLQSFIDAGVLVISDAGAARGNFEQSRVEQTNEFIQLVRRYTQNIAWLNPTPVGRWSGTTADAIRQKCAVPMFELNRLGLDTAVNIMRGR